MGTITKLKNGKYQIRIYLGKIDGKSKFKKITCSTIRECKAREREFLIEWKLNNIKNKEPKYPTVQEAVEQFVDSRSNILSPSTVRGYIQIAKNGFKSIANIPINKLSQLDFQQSINADCVKYSPKTIKNIYSLVLHSLSIYGYNFKADYPKPNKKEICAPTTEYVQNLIILFKDTDYKIPIMLAALCGLRRSEICELYWSDIDFKTRTLSVNKAIVPNQFNKYVLKSTKSPASNRSVQIPEPLFSELKKRRGIGKIVNLSPRQITKQFRQMQEKNFGKHIRFHDLRHYYASIMLALGIPDKYAMKFIGHSSVEMLRGTYQHTFSNVENAMFEKMNRYFSNAIKIGVPMGVQIGSKYD